MSTASAGAPDSVCRVGCIIDSRGHLPCLGCRISSQTPRGQLVGSVVDKAILLVEDARYQTDISDHVHVFNVSRMREAAQEKDGQG